MPSYLNNCTVTQYGPVLENEGDSPLTQTLETQLPPSFIQNGVEVLASTFNTAMHAHFWFVISANPGYHIHTGMITIAGQAADSSDFNDIGTNSSTGEVMLTPNGVHLWGLDPDTNLPNDVNAIMTVDSKLDKWNECDNQVIVLVNIEEGFSMPSYNVQFLIDLDGSAEFCRDGIEDDSNLRWEMQTTLWVTNEDTCGPIRIARYFNDTSTSPNNLARWIHTSNSWPISTCYPGAEQPIEIWPWAQGDGFDPCVGQLQPTCYRNRHQRFENYGWLNEPTVDAPYTIATVEGRIAATSGSTSSFATNYNEAGWLEFGFVQFCGTESKYYYQALPIVSSWSAFEWVPITEYPLFTPGGLHIPSEEIWYLKYQPWGGTAAIKKLIADPEFIDIWAAMTVVKDTNGQSYSWSGGNWMDGPSGVATGALADSNYHLVHEYTSENNQCDLDLSNAVLEQVDDQTVKITIPYNVNNYDGWVRSNISGAVGSADRKRNEIFVNIYPVDF